MREHMPLVIELKIKESSVYCYFHDSANTYIGISYGETLIELYQQEGYENSTLEPEIIGYEIFHKFRKVCPFGIGGALAGLCEETYEYMCKKYPDYSFEECTYRNAGFIFMSEPKESKTAFDCVQKMQSIPSDSFIIDFDKKLVSFGLFRIDTAESYIHKLETAELRDPEPVMPEDLPVIDYDFKNIPIDDFENLFGLLYEQSSFAHFEGGKRLIYSIIFR